MKHPVHCKHQWWIPCTYYVPYFGLLALIRQQLHLTPHSMLHSSQIQQDCASSFETTCCPLVNEVKMLAQALQKIPAPHGNPKWRKLFEDVMLRAYRCRAATMKKVVSVVEFLGGEACTVEGVDLRPLQGAELALVTIFPRAATNLIYFQLKRKRIQNLARTTGITSAPLLCPCPHSTVHNPHDAYQFVHVLVEANICNNPLQLKAEANPRIEEAIVSPTHTLKWSQMVAYSSCSAHVLAKS